MLAVHHFVRKLTLLTHLQTALGRRTQEVPLADSARNLRLVRTVTWTQIVLTLSRLIAVLAASIALPWSVAEKGYGAQIDADSSIPFWIALGAVLTAAASTIGFFIVEYVVRYNLSPKLGEFVCECFRDEIENMHKVLSEPWNSTDPMQVQDRETWEYVAREFLHRYRFDTVFAADRFGSILQYIQGGMQRR